MTSEKQENIFDIHKALQDYFQGNVSEVNKELEKVLEN